MKNTRYLKSALLGIAGLLLANTLGLAQPASDVTLNTFDTSTDIGNWTRFWGGAANNSYLTWDSVVDAQGHANSGALKIMAAFDAVAHSGDNQFSYFGTTQPGNTWLGANPVDGTKYTNLVFDLLWDPSSPQNASDFGPLDIGLATTSYGQIWLTTYTVPTNSGWHHIVVPIDPTAPNLQNVGGIVLKMWSPPFTGTSVFWVDNVKLIAKQGPPPPPPSIKLSKVTTTGLQMVSTASDGGNVRQGIHAVNPVSWVGSPTPVTYSVTITNYPDSTHPNLQTHIFLAPGSGLPYGPGDSSMDWNATNLVFVQIQNRADGTAGATFMYKTNVDGGPSNGDRWEGQIFGSNTLATISAPGILGTWSVTFNQDTNVTITVPGGGSTNFIMPAASVALFADPLYAAFGMQPNNSGNIGQPVTFGNVSITGVSTPANDSFTTAPLDTSTWGLTAGDAAGVTVVPLDSAYWLKWTLPDSGFSLQTSSSITDSNSWVDPGLTASAFAGAKNVLIPNSSLPGTNGFFRLVKPSP
jgi:hypothetical protein